MPVAELYATNEPNIATNNQRSLSSSIGQCGLLFVIGGFYMFIVF